MLLLTDRARKVSAILSSVWMLTLTLLPTVEAIAADAAFTAGQASGQAGVAAVSGIFSNPAKIQSLGIAGLGTQVPPSSLTDLYKGGGKNGADSIGALNAAGVQAMQSAQTCAAGDASCQARNSAGKAYQNQLTGQDPRAKYKQTAEALRHAQMAGDPLAILGIGIPNAGGGSVCVQSTATVPSYQTTTSCLQATFQTLHSLPVLPVTTGKLETSPYCIDPTMTLSANQSLCSKTVYSCPNGGTLNGTSCVITSDPTITYSGCSTIDAKTGVGDWGAPQGDELRTQITCNENQGTMNFYTDAHGIWASGCGPSWHTMPIQDYYGQLIAQHRPSWNAWNNPVSSWITGSCSNGYCDYKVEYLHLKYSSLPKTCSNVLITTDWGFQYSVEQCEGMPVEMSGYSFMSFSGSGGTCPSHPYFTDVYSDNSEYPTTYYDYYKFYYAPNIAHSTHSFRVPQKPQYNCPVGATYQNGLCTLSYPATASTTTASPGCLGAPIPSGNTADGGTQLVAGMVNGQAGLTCQTTYYSCPATMNMNGMLCEDPSKPSYQNPNCKYLGKDTNTQGETYLCLNNQLDECAALDLSQCTNTNNACIFTDNVVGSNTYGQCIATQKDYSCTVPAQTTTINQCGYDPMCYNGNCFTPPGTNCKAKTIDTTKTEPSSCNVITQQVYRQCSLVEQTNAQSVVTGYTAGADCANINNQGGTPLTCTQIPPTFDATTGHYPQKLNYSCLSAPVNTCSTLAATAGCSASSNQCLEYQCLDPVSNTIGSQEQAGAFSATIFGNTPSTLGANTCINKGACLNEQKIYSCTTTTSMPGDECTTDLSQVLVSMETARQAGTYMDQTKMKIFSGDTDKCDRNAFSVFGAGLGSKSCCNISAPDAKSNQDILGNALRGTAIQGVGSILNYGTSKSSQYMFDFMMNDNKFTDAAAAMWSNGIGTDAAFAAASGQSIPFTPSVSVMGLSASFSPIGNGIGNTVAGWAGLSSPASPIAALTPYDLGSLGTPFGSLNFSVDPVSLGFQAAYQLWQAYQAALACDEEDYKSTTKTNAKLCYSTGTWCEHKDCGIFGCTCTKYRTGKCCFNSKLARIINQQGRGQLGLDMRDCGGFTVAQIQQLDWSKIDLTEFIADMLAQAKASTTNIMQNSITPLQNKLQQSTTTNGINKAQPSLPIKQ